MGKIRHFVIGGSVGGLEALRRVAAQLPRDFPASICVVIHVAADSPGLIPEILNHAGALEARHAEDGDELAPGRIFVAPPDRHLLIGQGGRLQLGRGPKENRFRPAIDALFRSAAQALDGTTAGVILSGGLDDGVAGLLAIKRRHGAALVQDPADAVAPSMPQAALRALKPDLVLPSAQIAAAMSELTVAYAAPSNQIALSDDLDNEIRVAAGAPGHPADVLKMGDPSIFTCPDCHGVMVRLRDDGPPRFRCHTGHAYSLQSMSEALRERSEDTLWSAIRAYEELAALQRMIAKHYSAPGDAERRVDALRLEAEAQRRSVLLREAAKT